MNKKAYIVQGVGESVGCRFITELLIKLGCNGNSGHEQEFQKYINNHYGFINFIKEKQYENFVIRFSFPHGKYLPDICDFYYRLKKNYEKVYIILVTRSWLCQEIGTIKGEHLINNPIPELKTLEDRMTYAYKKIFYDLYKIEHGTFKDFVVLNLNDLVTNEKEHIDYLAKKINLSIPENFDYSFIKKDVDKKRILEYKKNNM